VPKVCVWNRVEHRSLCMCVEDGLFRLESRPRPCQHAQQEQATIEVTWYQLKRRRSLITRISADVITIPVCHSALSCTAFVAVLRHESVSVFSRKALTTSRGRTLYTTNPPCDTSFTRNYIGNGRDRAE
jgi:hypothetical protein